jgi:hypothetical protein
MLVEDSIMCLAPVLVPISLPFGGAARLCNKLLQLVCCSGRSACITNRRCASITPAHKRRACITAVARTRVPWSPHIGWQRSRQSTRGVLPQVPTESRRRACALLHSPHSHCQGFCRPCCCFVGERIKGEWAVHHHLGHACGEAQEVQVERPRYDDGVGQLGR